MPTYVGVFSDRGRYSLVLDVSQGTQEIGNNRTLVWWSLRIDETTENGSYDGNHLTWNVNIGGQGASGSTPYNFNNYNSLLLGSGSFWITHNSDGTMSIYTGATAGGGTTIGSAGAGGTWSLTTIPRASTPTFSPSPVDAGQAVDINMNRASSSFTHTVKYQLGSASGTIGTGIQGSTSWTPPLTLLNQMTNTDVGSVLITTDTYNGASLIGSRTTTMLLRAPTSVVPTFTTVTHAEATPGVAANIGGYVQGISTLALAITGAAGVYGSTISSYKITVAGQTINSSTGTTTPIGTSGATVAIVGTVTDSRGRTASKTVNITVLAYSPPKFVTQPTVQRSLSNGTVNEEGTYLRENINASVSSLVVGSAQKNALGYKISTRVAGTTAWTLKTNTPTTGITFNSYVNVGTYSVTTAYDVLIEVYDDFSTSAIIIQVPVAKIFMHWDGSVGVGFGKYRENGTVDVMGDIYLREEAATGEKGSLFLPAGGNVFIAGTSIQREGTTAERNAIFGVPANAAQQAALANRKIRWNNTDTGFEETYYATTGTAGLTARGLMAGVSSGWYPVGPGPKIVRTPIAESPTSQGQNMVWNNSTTYRTDLGATWFTLNTWQVVVNFAGMYRAWFWTQQQVGTGQANFLLRHVNAANNGVLAQQDQLAPALSPSYLARVSAEVENIFAKPSERFDSVLHAGNLTLHKQGESTGIRGQFGVEYLGPALVSY